MFFIKSHLIREFNPIDSLIMRCLKGCIFIQSVLCSYEMNAYYIGKLKKIEDFNPIVLSHFPIVYSKDPVTGLFVKTINTAAQDIFV